MLCHHVHLRRVVLHMVVRYHHLVLLPHLLLLLAPSHLLPHQLLLLLLLLLLMSHLAVRAMLGVHRHRVLLLRLLLPRGGTARLHRRMHGEPAGIRAVRRRALHR